MGFTIRRNSTKWNDGEERPALPKRLLGRIAVARLDVPHRTAAPKVWARVLKLSLDNQRCHTQHLHFSSGFITSVLSAFLFFLLLLTFVLLVFWRHFNDVNRHSPPQESFIRTVHVQGHILRPSILGEMYKVFSTLVITFLHKTMNYVLARSSLASWSPSSHRVRRHGADAWALNWICSLIAIGA